MAIDSQPLMVFTFLIRAVVFALYFVYRYQLCIFRSSANLNILILLVLISIPLSIFRIILTTFFNTILNSKVETLFALLPIEISQIVCCLLISDTIYYSYTSLLKILSLLGSLKSYIILYKLVR